MLYDKYLKELKKCPFCNLKKEEIIRKNKHSFLIYTRSPYTKDHSLVIPKRHIFSINELNTEEKRYVDRLVFYALKKLHKKYKNVTVLFREGNKKEIGKSIDHLHIHLIPNLRIGPYDIKLKRREYLDEKEYLKLTKRAKKIFN